MRIHPLWFVALAACGDMDMSGDVEAMHTTLTAAGNENTAYQTSAHEQGSMAALITVVDGHASRMHDLLGTMSTHMAQMEGCVSATGMMSMHGSMMDGLDAHVATMHGISDMPAGMMQVDMHVGQMASMIENMHLALASPHCSM